MLAGSYGLGLGHGCGAAGGCALASFKGEDRARHPAPTQLDVWLKAWRQCARPEPAAPRMARQAPTRDRPLTWRWLLACRESCRNLVVPPLQLVKQWCPGLALHLPDCAVAFAAAISNVKTSIQNSGSLADQAFSAVCAANPNQQMQSLRLTMPRVKGLSSSWIWRR